MVEGLDYPVLPNIYAHDLAHGRINPGNVVANAVVVSANLGKQGRFAFMSLLISSKRTPKF